MIAAKKEMTRPVLNLVRKTNEIIVWILSASVIEIRVTAMIAI
jgi:hypothetical protein